MIRVSRMMDDKSFRDLFDQALKLHRQEFSVNDNAIGKAIAVIHKEYSAKEWKGCSTSQPVNYNDPAYRCAYLHKYASCHAALVRKAVLTMLSTNTPILWNNIASCDSISICCLGGGPGTDVIGLSSVFCLLDYYRNSRFDFTVVDCMAEWYYALLSVLTAASLSPCGALAPFASNCNYRYLKADLLACIPDAVIDAVGSADMITMVKFVSAAACDATPNMLKIIFTSLKPGALVFFIDNAAGGFYEMVSAAAYMYGLSTESGPFRHMKFENEVFKRKLFGFFSLSSTTVAVQMWRKNFTVLWNRRESFLTSQMGFHSAENSSTIPPSNYGNALTKKKSRSRSAKRTAGTDELRAKKLTDASKGESFSNASQYCTKTQNRETTPLLKENQSGSSLKICSKGDCVRNKQQSMYAKPCHSNQNLNTSLLCPSISSCQYTGSEVTPLLKEKTSSIKKTSSTGDSLGNKQKFMCAKPNHSKQNLNPTLFCPSVSSWQCTGSEVTPLIKEKKSGTLIKKTSYKGDTVEDKQQSVHGKSSNQYLNSSVSSPCQSTSLEPHTSSTKSHGVVAHNDLKSQTSSHNPKVRGKGNNVHNARTRSSLPVDVTPHESGVAQNRQPFGTRKTTNSKLAEIMDSCCCVIS